MKAVLQRVSQASVTVSGETVAQINQGMLILLGIEPEDTAEIAEQMAEKIALMRIFEDHDHKMNLSLLDVSGEALVVSQFTLLADTRKGRRPSFIHAASPTLADPLVTHFTATLIELGVPTQTGIFGADMQVALTNDGPVTIVLGY